jgi:uncharacterized protein YbjT (DUF2867 family)
MHKRSHTALVIGASGLVGRELLRQLTAADSGYVTVHALVRRLIEPAPEDVRMHVVDFTNLPQPLPAADDLYCALGTTIKVAGSRAAFRAVDFDAVVDCAKAAQAAGVRRMAVVSALGADARSRVFYNQVKGQMEDALRVLGFDRLVIARPSLLAGARAALGQTPRYAEQLSLRLLRPIGGMLPAAIRPIDASVVARAMRVALNADGPAAQVIESAALQQLGAKPA